MLLIQRLPFFIIVCIASLLHIQTNAIANPNNNRTRTVRLSIALPESIVLFQDSLTLTLSGNGILSEWHYLQEPLLYINQSGKERSAYEHTIHCLLTINQNESPDPATLHISFNTNTQQQKSITRTIMIDSKIDTYTITLADATQSMSFAGYFQKLLNAFAQLFVDFSNFLEALVNHAQSSFAILIIVTFFLGLFTSLTPCIYPMIPITIGILQGGAQKTVSGNFLRATSYACGMSLTFALFGFLASKTGALFGKAASHPIVLLILALFFAYLAGSMMGWYELSLPRWMSQSKATDTKGSYSGAFIFGVVSGTIASPCLSPTLAMVIKVASGWHSLGAFLLLFSYGIGTSTPLLLIATYTQSLGMLPRAGAWMITIKKFFGIMLFGMSIYLIRGLFLPYIYMGIMGCFAALVASYYRKEDRKNPSHLFKIVWALSLIASLRFFTQSIHLLLNPELRTAWIHDLQLATELAQSQDKLILVNISSPNSCIACETLERTLLHTREFETTAQEKVVLVGIQGDDSKNADILKQYNVQGWPTVLLLDPQANNQVIARWGGNLQRFTVAQAVALLERSAT